MPKNEPFFQRKFLKYENCKCKCHLNKSPNSEKWGFEFKAGKPTLYRQIRKNEVSTSKYTAMNFLPKTCVLLIKRPVNLYFFVLSLVMLIRPALSPFSSWIYISLLAITVTVNIMVELWLDTRRQMNDILINEQMATKAENQHPLKPNIKWRDIQIGDIIYIRKEEVCPADIIILDASEISGKEAFCYLDSSNVDGSIGYTKKKASILSQSPFFLRNIKTFRTVVNRLPAKNHFKEYRKLISGKLEYEPPTPVPTDFLGYLRLKKDPKVEQLTIENFIPRGAILKYSDWVFGLVVFTGNETKIMLNSNYGRHKVSVLETTVNYYCLFMGIVIFMITIISIIIMIARVKELHYLIVQDPNADSSINFFTHMILYSPILPLVIFSNLDSVMIFQKFFIERKVKDNSKHFINVSDPNTFTNIAQIQYIFLDKTGTITKTQYKVSEVFFNNRLYLIDQEKLHRKMRIMPQSEKNKLFKMPFQGVSTNGEVLYASQNLNGTVFDKSRKMSNISMMSSPRSPVKQPLIKINEKEKEDDYFKRGEDNIFASQTLLPILKKKQDIEASNVEEDYDYIQKSPIHSLKITPHSEFRGKFNHLSGQNQNMPSIPKKSKININQLIESQSTQGLNISQKLDCFNNAYSTNNEVPKYFAQSSERSPINQIELSIYKENPNPPINQIELSIYKENPNISLFSAKNEAKELLIPPDSSGMPLNSNSSFSQHILTNGLSPRSESHRKFDESPFNTFTPNNQKTHDFFYAEGHFIKDLYRSNAEFNLDYLFEALTLCHASKTLAPAERERNAGNNEKIPVEKEKSMMRNSIEFRSAFSSSVTDTKLEYRNKEDQVILDFARSCGFTFEKTEPLENPSQYFLKMKGHKLVYNVYGINDFCSEKKKSFSIVLKSPVRDSEVFLLCRGQEDYMRERLLLEKHEEEMLEAVLRDMHANGLKPVIYAKRSLPDYEAWTYINKIRNLTTSLINQTEELTHLAMELEKDMSLLCVIGLKDELNEGVDELMTFAHDADINVWILTGDSKANAISTASAIGLFDAKVDKQKELTSEDQESLVLQLRSLLSEIKNIYMLNFFEMIDNSRKSLEYSKKSLRKSFTKSIEDFFLKKIENWQTSNHETFAKFQDLKNRLSKEYLVLNGKSLDIIYRDPYLKPHFVFLLSLFKKVIAYNMTPGHKYLLTDTVQSLFMDNPSVMAVGDGYNDSLMLQAAHIGVELLQNIGNSVAFKRKGKLNAGDLQISSLAVLKQLMLVEGMRRLTLMDNFVYILFYKGFLIGWTLFLYNWFCSFTGTSIFTSIVIFLYSFFFFSFTLIIYSLFDKPVSEATLLHFPALYKEALLKKRNLILRIVIKSLIEGITHSFIIFYFTIISLSNALINDGLVTDFKMMSFALSTSLVFVPNVKILFLCLGHNLKLIIIGFIISVFMYAAFIFLGSHSLIGRPDWGEAVMNLLNNGNCFVIIVFNIWVSQLISFVYERYILKKILYSSVKEKLADFNYLKTLTNEKIIKDLELPMDIGTLVKRIFGGAESLDPSIQEMFTPADINVNEIELNRYSLIIKDPSLEQKFNFSNIRDTIKKTLMMYYTSLGLFCIFMIYALAAYSNKTIGFLCLGAFLLLALLSGCFFNKNLQKNFIYYAKFLMMLIISMKIILDWISDGRNTGLGAAVVAHTSTLNLSLGFSFTFLVNVVHYISYFITILCIYYGAYPFILGYNDGGTNQTSPQNLDNLQQFYGVWSLIVLITTITILSLYSNYKFEKLRRSEFLAKSRMEQEANNIEDILAILVPKFVKDQISQGAFSMQESQDDIAILFCDMCDFDHIITTENLKIVQILDEIFRNFDILCIKHGVQKIETVGKTYMACAGLKACEISFSENVLKTEKTRRLVSMAFEMMKFMEKVTIGKGETIKLKIGIHIGTVIAGVIGHHKPQFSLIGDTVNTTSRVCSTGAEGMITISDAAYQNIKNSNLEFLRKVVQAKGKGDVITYQVLKQRRKKTNKESKFKKRVMRHMGEIKKMYMQSVRESENLIEKPKTIHKAVNLMTNWYFQNKYETFEERNSLNYNNTNGTKAKDDINENLDHEETSQMVEEEILKPSNEIFLTFNPENSRIVQQFRSSLQIICKEEAKVYLTFFFAVFLFQTLLLISVKSQIDYSDFIIGMRGVYNFTILISLMSVSYLSNQKMINAIVFLVYFIGVGVLLVQIEKGQIVEIQEEGILELILLYLIHSNSNLLTFIGVVILTCITFSIWIIDYGVNGLISGQNLFFMLAMLIFNLLKVNFQMRHHIDSFNNLLNNESKKQEQNNLVSQLLPFHAFEKLKNISVTNKIELTDFFCEVTLLFADIAGFTKYSSSVRPEDVVNMLRSLFTEFDKMCLHHRVYKVYTIGDCYVVMGFLNANHRNPLEEAKNVVKMGLSMIEIIRDVRKNIDFPSLDMRIGVHTGDIIGGIIGTDIVRYDIYGRDVLIANKMESNGLEGHIMVSETTKKLLEKDENLQFRFEKLKDVECKVIPEPIPGYLIYRKEKPQVNLFND